MLVHCWKIALFGTLCLENNAGVAITRFATQKTGLLLACLALNGERPPVTREHLADLLWPDSSPEAARHSLRQSVASLRRHLEPPGTPRGSVLIAHGHQSLSLNPEAVTVDTIAFEKAIRSAAQLKGKPGERSALETALEICRGELLDGYFDDWVLAERQRLNALFLSALQTVITLCRQQNENETALRFALQYAALSPLEEDPQATAITLYQDLRRPDDGRRHFDAFARRLSEQLSEKPSPELTALLQEVSEVSAPPRTDRKPAPAIAPEPAPIRTPRTLLPAPLTRFFGRQTEKDLLLNSLRDPGIRLITLTGPGGSGKTRLAVETAHLAAQTLPERFGGVIAFVPLADQTNAERLPESLWAVLAASGLLPVRPATTDRLPQIIACLNETPSLLVLDNFEHLVTEGAMFLRLLLERTPALTCLITSRHSLGIPGEREFPVTPLPTPSFSGTPPRLMEFASVQLFVDRAQAVRPDFQITERNASAMASLCQRLEGIPLAIELAAARARALAPAQILAQLEDRFAFLQSRDPNAAERHRTLHAAIDGSVRVLPQDLSRFFLALAVFRGGWTLETAQSVAINTTDSEKTLEFLERLAQASLIVPTDTGDTIRFRMLETLREYALTETGETQRRETEKRHAACFTDFAETKAKEMAGPGQGDALKSFDTERENLRTALTTAKREGDSSALLRLAASQALYWAMRGEFREGRSVLADAFAASAHITEQDVENAPRLRTRIADAIASMCAQSGDFTEAKTWAERSLALSRAIPDDFGIARSLNNLGSMAVDQMQWENAEAFLTEGLTVAAKTGHPQMIAAMRNNLALALMETGRLETAATLYRENLVLRREMADWRGVALTLLNLADIYIRWQDCAEASRLYRQSLSHLQTLGDLPNTAIALEGLGESLLSANIPSDSIRSAFLFGAASRLRERIGAQQRPAFAAVYPQFEARLRETLGDATFQQHFLRGQNTPLEQVLDRETASIPTLS